MKYRKVNIKDVLAVLGRLLILVIIEIGTAIVLVPGHLWVWIGGMILMVFWIIGWHCQNFGYECEKCGHKQMINFLTDFFSLNFFSRKYLKCKKCKKWSKAKLLRIDKK
jgi:hypothetical protein